MQKEKILIYDFKRGFSRFIKLRLSAKYEFEIFNNKSLLKDLKIDEHLAVIMIIADYTDLVDLLYIHSRTKNIIVFCEIEAIKYKIYDLEDIILLDLNKIKKELLIDIKTNFDLFLELKIK